MGVALEKEPAGLCNTSPSCNCLSVRPGHRQGTLLLSLSPQLDLGIPAMTKCCNQLDVCYDTCGANKYRCDAKFRWCLHSICSDLKRSLGFVSKVEGRLPGSCPLWREQAMAGWGGWGQGVLSLSKEAKICSREQHICPVLVTDESEMSENTEICPSTHTSVP